MKTKLLILFIVVSAYAFGQMQTITIASDTLKGADTVYINLPSFYGFHAVSLDLYFEEIGGTSDGYGFLESAPDDTSWARVPNIESLVEVSDTLTVENLTRERIWIVGTIDKRYRAIIFGTVGDTTAIHSKCIKKL